MDCTIQAKILCSTCERHVNLRTKGNSGRYNGETDYKISV